MTNFRLFFQHKWLLSKFSLVLLCNFSIILTTNAASISGELSFSGKGANRAKLSDIIIYYQPSIKYLNTALDSPLQINMKKKAYKPRVSAVPVGSKIQVTNYDRILHNAFSPSGDNSFDLGLYGKNKNKTHTLNQEGIVKIFCNVHFHMVAYVLVLDTPFHTRADTSGLFHLSNLPEGEGTLTIWNERSEQINLKVSLPYSKKIVLDIPITKRRIPEHKTKSGSSYRKKRRSRRF